MLAHEYRLHRSSDFARVIRGGSRAHGGVLIVHLATGPASSTRVGLVVSKAVGNSVIRHRVSRRLRAILFTRIDAIGPGSDLVVRALPGAATASSAELSAGVDRALRTLSARRRDRTPARARPLSVPSSSAASSTSPAVTS